jgi:hypothetical protein
MPELENVSSVPKSKQIAAERREKHAERFRQYQDKANKRLAEKKSNCKQPVTHTLSLSKPYFCIVYALDDRKIIKLKTKPLNQIKDSLKRISEEFNFNYRGIDGTMRQYLGKGKHDKDVNVPSRKPVTAFKKLEK